METRLRTDQQSQKANTKQTKKGRTLGTRLLLNCLNYDMEAGHALIGGRL